MQSVHVGSVHVGSVHVGSMHVGSMRVATRLSFPLALVPFLLLFGCAPEDEVEEVVFDAGQAQMSGNIFFTNPPGGTVDAFINNLTVVDAPNAVKAVETTDGDESSNAYTPLNAVPDVSASYSLTAPFPGGSGNPRFRLSVERLRFDNSTDLPLDWLSIVT